MSRLMCSLTFLVGLSVGTLARGERGARSSRFAGKGRNSEETPCYREIVRSLVHMFTASHSDY